MFLLEREGEGNGEKKVKERAEEGKEVPRS
jgi:hypothetical protein